MTCTSCTPASVAEQEAAVVRWASSRIAAVSGRPAMQSGTKIEVIDAAAMKAKWVEVRMADWRKANRSRMIPIGSRRGTELSRATAQQHYEKMYGEGEIHAFAYGDTVYVSPELPESAVASCTPSCTRPLADWMFDNNGPEVANQMNESPTEYFNSQSPCSAQPPTGKPVGAEYTVGRDVLVELRDERLPARTGISSSAASTSTAT
ncbi:MAG: hypothetical protein U0235_08390 [Polyangiaceae bacterium]